MVESGIFSISGLRDRVETGFEAKAGFATMPRWLADPNIPGRIAQTAQVISIGRVGFDSHKLKKFTLERPKGNFFQFVTPESDPETKFT